MEMLPEMSEKFDVVLKQVMLAKREMGSVVTKDLKNPFHKNKYASLGAHLDLCEGILDSHGLILLQTVNGSHDKAILIANICHPESGQWIKSYLPLPNPKNDSQGLGAAITYMRRYSIGSMLGLTAEDDDGETAVGRGNHPDAKKEKAMPVAKLLDPAKVKEATNGPKMSIEQSEELYSLAEQCPPELIAKIRKFMKSTFGAESFEQCPISQFDVFKSSMLKNIEMNKEKTA